MYEYSPLHLRLGEMVSNVTLELLHEERGAFATTAFMANGVFNLNFVEDGTILQGDGDSVANGALLGIVIVDAEAFVFNACDLGAQFVDTRIRSFRVGAIQELVNLGTLQKASKHVLRFSGKFAEDQRISDHVVDVMAKDSPISE